MRNEHALLCQHNKCDCFFGSIPKVTAQLELASIYESTQPADAMRIYEQIRSENPKGGPAVEQANSRLATVKR